MKKYQSTISRLFPKSYQLIDGTDEIFELDLAFWEYKSLSSEELIQRSAYFRSIDGKQTVHYQICNNQNLEEIHKNSSFRTKIFFLNGKYSTGYATHSLFPYRGKFHPQMIRAILNVIGIKPGDTVLDPMSGSATLSVEANLLGINSIGIDLSPFCNLMGRVKTFSLELDVDRLKKLSSNPNKILSKLNKPRVPRYFLNNKDDENKPYYEILLLAFLDSIGFARRSGKSLEVLFPKVLERYILTILNFQKAREKVELKIGKSKIIKGNVMNLSLDDNEVDAIITSPPYSFAIDYVDNDLPQIEYLGYSTGEIKQKMIGLQGRGIKEKLKMYFDNLSIALKEMKRVTKNNGTVVIIVGTNDIQTQGVRLETNIREIAEDQGLKFISQILKPIKGLQNTMKEEYILFFKNSK